jgi:hypothetical protein
MQKFIAAIKSFAAVVKQNPAECAVILVIGFTLGALHNYFGL